MICPFPCPSSRSLKSAAQRVRDVYTRAPGTGVHVLVALVSGWKYLDMWPFSVPLELGFGHFQKSQLRITLPAPHSSVRHTTGRLSSVYHSNNFRAVSFGSFGPHFQSELSLQPSGRPALVWERSCALGDSRMKKEPSACKEGLHAKCVPDGDVNWEIRCPSGAIGHDVFSLHLGKYYHPLVTAGVTLVFVLGQGLHLAAPADF